MPDRNIRKRNPKRSQTAAKQRREAEKTLNELHKKMNKTPEEKYSLEKWRRLIEHLKLKEKQKSEPHARKGERH